MEGHTPAAPATAKPALVPLIVIKPSTPTHSEIAARNWHSEMYFVCCDIKTRPTWSAGTGICGLPGDDWSNRQPEPAGAQIRGETDIAGRCTRGAEERSAVYRTCRHGTEGMLSPATDNRIAYADHGPAFTTHPACGMRSVDIRTSVGDIETAAAGSQDDCQDGSDRWGPPTRAGWYDLGPLTVMRRSPSFKDACTVRRILSSTGIPDSPPATRGPRREVSRLAGLFRIRSESVDRQDCSTLDGHTTKAPQLSRRTVEAAVLIQPPEGSILSPDLATNTGWCNDRAGRPTSVLTTPGRRVWGPRLSSQRWSENVGDST